VSGQLKIHRGVAHQKINRTLSTSLLSVFVRPHDSFGTYLGGVAVFVTLHLIKFPCNSNPARCQDFPVT
jgi:hypothetical protein